MAHVLLPCDLPTWVDVQHHLSQLMTCKDAAQMSQVMAKIYEICCISLDPDEQQPAKEHDGFRQLRHFVEEVLEVEERSKFLDKTLPAVVAHALSLRTVKPTTGFLYSLKREDETFELERCFVVSLLANAFLNTFPKRNSKTHPTLQDFSFTDFFAHLRSRNHQRKLRLFLKYFDAVETKPTGCVKFTRKGVSSPSLPGWLCSNRPLVPLIVRHEGDVHEAEPQLLRACSCSALIGGDVLKSASSQEASLFFSFPELLVCLSFVECLGDNEALVAEGISNSTGSGRSSSAQNCWSPSENHFCLLDSAEWRDEPGRQFGDGSLWRELNKALAAFTYDPLIPPVPDIAPKQRRQTPVGESSSSDAASHRSLSKLDASSNGSREPRGGRGSSKDPYEGRPVVKVPPITKLPPSEEILDTVHRRHSFNDTKVTPWYKLSGQPSTKSATSLFRKSHSGHSSGKISLRTASQSSVELPPIHPLPEEEFYTADEDSGEGSESHSKSSHRGCCKRRDKRTSIAMSDLLKEDLEIGSSRRKASAKHINRESSSEVSRESRSGSAGFVLGDSEEESEPWGGARPEEHERLDDFRRRVRKRTRRRASRRSSRSSYSAGSGSSDMEDISEDPELAPRGALRPASSEPSLLTAAAQHGSESPAPFRLSDEAALLCLGGGRKLMVTSSHGQPKAYSYDGVSPNLPVPFRAAFRRRRLEQGHSRSLDAEMDFLWSASMAERSSSADDLSSCSRTRESLELASGASEGGPGVRQWKRWPVAAEPRARPGEDPQLKALVLWLAASLADVPFLILYAAREPELNELNSVYSQVLNRHWTVGDLSCEVLRFCRNKSKHRTCLGLFGQLLGKEVPAKSSLTYNLSQQSLD